MKLFLSSTAIIVSLIVVLLITDHMLVDRNGNVHAFQRENLTNNRKTTVSVQNTQFGIELFPAVETKFSETRNTKTNLVEGNPETESKPTVIKPLPEPRPEETNPVEVKDSSVAQSPAESVGTTEEGIEPNDDATSPQRNKANAMSSQTFIHKIGMNNKIHYVFSLLPFLLIIDLLFFKRRKKANSRGTEYFSLPRRIRILFSVSLLAFGVLVFVPWSVYFGNSLQFPFIFQDFVNWNLRVLTLSILGASIVLLLIPPNISDYLVAIIAGLGLCVYVQSMFMNQYLGTMNGIEPQWSEHRFFGIMNMIIWIAIALSPVILRKAAPSYFSKVIPAATGIVLFLEFIATAFMVHSAPGVWFRTNKSFVDGSKQFQLSKKKNVIVFIFDTLGSEYVKQCFEVYPEAKEIVKDFIWYTDARANYHMTFPGLTHELTGTMLPVPANSFNELFQNMWRSSSAKSFYKQMKEAGYDARLYCAVNTSYEIGPIEYFRDYFSNIQSQRITYKIDYNRLHNCLKQMSGYCSVPFFFKKLFFYSFDFSDGVVQTFVAGIPSDHFLTPKTNDTFLKKMVSSGITPSEDEPILAFYYTTGVHRPWYLDESCNKMKYPFDNPCPTTRSCFYILSEFIRLLKEANIYDNTAILVCSDHGGNDTGAGNGKYDLTFMIKPLNANKNELSIDETKVLSIDILPTLLYMACGENADFKDFEGYPPNNIPPERVRKVYKFYCDKKTPPANLDLDKCYPGCRGIEEYIFNDLNTFKLEPNSESFVRQIPLIINP